jgi:hypothetical protein
MWHAGFYVGAVSIALLLIASDVRASTPRELAPEETRAIHTIHRTVLANFTPGITDQKLKFYAGDTLFRADCKGFSIAIHYQLTRMGFDPQLFIVQLPSGQQHMITCLGYHCADNNLPAPITVNSVLRRYEVVGITYLPREFIDKHYR